MDGQEEALMTSLSAPPPLGAYLEYWLRYVSNQASYAFGRRLEVEGVTVAEWTMLRELYGEVAIAPGRLADRLGLTPSAISKLAERLTAKALVVRRFHPDDTRTHSLELSAQGRALIPRLGALADQNDAAFFACMDVEKRVLLAKLLKDLAEHRGLKASTFGSRPEPRTL
jgi:DNA-binding MarR family transcriptional regulator